MSHPRNGFTLVEIIVVLALVMALAAVVAPAMIGQVEQARVKRTAESLIALADAIDDPARGGGAFRQHVGFYPGALSHLTRPISTADASACGTPYAPADSAGWRGPYLNRLVPPDGLPLPVGEALDTLVRELAVPRPDPMLRIRIAGLQLDEAHALDALLDGVVSAGAGGFRWTGADPEGFVDAGYLIPMKDC